MHSAVASQPYSSSIRLFKSRVSVPCCSFRRHVSSKARDLQQAEFFRFQVVDVYTKHAEQPVGLYVQLQFFKGCLIYT